MALGSILLILALLILVALVVIAPLLSDEQLGAGLDAKHSHWIAERERVLEALLELDFDQQLGKVPPEVYIEQRQQLMGQGAEALKQLEALGEADSAESLEKTLAGRRSKSPQDDQLEKLIAKRKKKVG